MARIDNGSPDRGGFLLLFWGMYSCNFPFFHYVDRVAVLKVVLNSIADCFRYGSCNLIAQFVKIGVFHSG